MQDLYYSDQKKLSIILKYYLNDANPLITLHIAVSIQELAVPAPPHSAKFSRDFRNAQQLEIKRPPVSCLRRAKQNRCGMRLL